MPSNKNILNEFNISNTKKNIENKSNENIVYSPGKLNINQTIKFIIITF